MQDHSETMKQLLRKLELLSKKQHQFSQEINDLRFQIEALKASIQREESQKVEEKQPIEVVTEAVFETPKKVVKETVSTPKPKVTVEKSETTFSSTPNQTVTDQKSNLEKFIGENLLNKIGIKTLILDKSSHPRFAIGESSTPIGNMILSDLADRYNLPELKPLATFGTWRDTYPNLVNGRKRGFSYFCCGYAAKDTCI